MIQQADLVLSAEIITVGEVVKSALKNIQLPQGREIYAVDLRVGGQIMKVDITGKEFDEVKERLLFVDYLNNETCFYEGKVRF